MIKKRVLQYECFRNRRYCDRETILGSGRLSGRMEYRTLPVVHCNSFTILEHVPSHCSQKLRAPWPWRNVKHGIETVYPEHITVAFTRGRAGACITGSAIVIYTLVAAYRRGYFGYFWDIPRNNFHRLNIPDQPGSEWTTGTDEWINYPDRNRWCIKSPDPDSGGFISPVTRAGRREFKKIKGYMEMPNHSDQYSGDVSYQCRYLLPWISNPVNDLVIPARELTF